MEMLDVTLHQEITLMWKINRIYRKRNRVGIVDDLKIKADSYYLHRLLRKQLIEFTETDLWQAHPKAVKPTNEGLNYFALKRAKVVTFLFRSIMIPIVVSIVTTLLAMWLHGYFE